jgi:glucokinase
MSIEAMSDINQLPIQEDLFVGFDVGGTKTEVADTDSTEILRYPTADYANMDEVLEEYVQAKGVRPAKIFVGWAGPRDADTGEVTLTNCDWPNFKPDEAAEKYGIKFETALDMVTIAEGVLREPDMELVQLKSGAPARTGTKLVVALSTGVGTSAAVWDKRSGRYVVMDGLGGHAGFQPKTDDEQQYLGHLLGKHAHASAERALSGKHGIDNLIEHYLNGKRAPRLVAAIEAAGEAESPVGAVLLEFATQDDGIDQEAAEATLQSMGALVGSVLRDWAVTYHATGGVYLTGSVSLALGEYLAQRTKMNDRFTEPGPEKDTWLEKVPISLVKDPHVAVVGALALAKEM